MSKYWETHLANVTHQSEVSIIEFLEDDRVSSLVGMTLESSLPEGLLYQFPVWSKAALFLHSQNGAELRESGVRENFAVLR